MRKRTVLLSTALLGALIFQAACSSAVTETLALIVSASSAAIDVVDPALASVVTPYFTEVTNAVDFATTELASSDSGAVKATKIAQQFAMIAAPSLPKGTAQTVVLAIEAVATAVQNFLKTISASSAELQSTPAGASAFFATGKGSMKMSRKEVEKIRAANDAVKRKLAKYRK
jgi:hypothetical protein